MAISSHLRFSFPSLRISESTRTTNSPGISPTARTPTSRPNLPTLSPSSPRTRSLPNQNLRIPPPPVRVRHFALTLSRSRCLFLPRGSLVTESSWTATPASSLPAAPCISRSPSTPPPASPEATRAQLLLRRLPPRECEPERARTGVAAPLHRLRPLLRSTLLQPGRTRGRLERSAAESQLGASQQLAEPARAGLSVIIPERLRATGFAARASAEP